MLRLALRPKWLALLLVALGIASAFAWLGSWQLARSRANATPLVIQAPQPLASVVAPQTALPDEAATTPVIVDGRIDTGQAVVVTGRRNAGEPVRWLVAPVLVEAGDTSARLPVVLGSFPAQGPVPAVPDARVHLVGMLQPSEDPAIAPDGSPTSVSSAGLIADWGQPIYAGFLFADRQLAAEVGVDAVPEPRVPSSTGYAVLNLSYAVQWFVFAAIACFIWWRLLRDAHLDDPAPAAEVTPGGHEGPDCDQKPADAAHAAGRDPAQPRSLTR